MCPGHSRSTAPTLRRLAACVVRAAALGVKQLSSCEAGSKTRVRQQAGIAGAGSLVLPPPLCRWWRYPPTAGVVGVVPYLLAAMLVLLASIDILVVYEWTNALPRDGGTQSWRI